VHSGSVPHPFIASDLGAYFLGGCLFSHKLVRILEAPLDANAELPMLMSY